MALPASVGLRQLQGEFVFGQLQTFATSCHLAGTVPSDCTARATLGRSTTWTSVISQHVHKRLPVTASSWVQSWTVWQSWPASRGVRGSKREAERFHDARFVPRDVSRRDEGPALAGGQACDDKHCSLRRAVQ
jgi:hypothetical protein